MTQSDWNPLFNNIAEAAGRLAPEFQPITVSTKDWSANAAVRYGIAEIMIGSILVTSAGPESVGISDLADDLYRWVSTHVDAVVRFDPASAQPGPPGLSDLLKMARAKDAPGTLSKAALGEKVIARYLGEHGFQQDAALQVALHTTKTTRSLCTAQ